MSAYGQQVVTGPSEHYGSVFSWRVGFTTKGLPCDGCADDRSWKTALTLR